MMLLLCRFLESAGRVIIKIGKVVQGIVQKPYMLWLKLRVWVCSDRLCVPCFVVITLAVTSSGCMRRCLGNGSSRNT